MFLLRINEVLFSFFNGFFFDFFPAHNYINWAHKIFTKSLSCFDFVWYAQEQKNRPSIKTWAVLRDFNKSLSDPAGIRTQDPYIKSVMLYQLSYGIIHFLQESFLKKKHFVCGPNLKIIILNRVANIVVFLALSKYFS